MLKKGRKPSLSLNPTEQTSVGIRDVEFQQNETKTLLYFLFVDNKYVFLLQIYVKIYSFLK